MYRPGDPEAQFITIDGGKYCYRKTGEGSPILLLHGITDSSRFFWTEFFQCFRNEYTVIALDLRGHGESEKPKHGYSAVDQAQLVAAFISKLGLDRVILLGHSLGGIIATRFTIVFPDRVSKLIIYDSPLGAGFWKDLWWVTRLPPGGAAIVGAIMVPVLGRLLFRLRSPRTMRLILELLRVFCNPAHIPSEIVQEKMKCTYEAVYYSLWQALILEDFDKDLHCVCAPTLIIRGAGDALVPQDRMEEVALKIPDSQLVIIDEACHFSLIERPEQFNQAVSTFLSRTE
jgi:pimeloyl-ACP methyl ester carboxylesterase